LPGHEVRHLIHVACDCIRDFPGTHLKSGDVVRVVNLPGAPKANTMQHCYVADINSGVFIGMVHTNSLHTKAEYIAYLRNRIAAHKDNPVNKSAIVWQGKAAL
jgi:hypothetical protein